MLHRLFISLSLPSTGPVYMLSLVSWSLLTSVASPNSGEVVCFIMQQSSSLFNLYAYKHSLYVIIMNVIKKMIATKYYFLCAIHCDISITWVTLSDSLTHKTTYGKY